MMWPASYTDFWCVHVLCDTQFLFHVQLCLQTWSTHIKGGGSSFVLISSQLSSQSSIAKNFKVKTVIFIIRGFVDDYVEM